jgi:DNA-binding transcriptional MerR regulator
MVSSDRDGSRRSTPVPDRRARHVELHRGPGVGHLVELDLRLKLERREVDPRHERCRKRLPQKTDRFKSTFSQAEHGAMAERRPATQPSAPNRLTLLQVETSTWLAMGQKLTIGELSRRTGVSVKTLRFYSDEGLLPPSGRSRSGYRLYTEEHVLRIDLIRTLREAGTGLQDIARVLRRDMTLEEVLELRLGAVEAHITALQRVASALRLAIRSGATEEHLRRITMVTRTSNEDRRRVIAAFYEKVVEGLPVDRQWTEGMIDASAASLPDTPTPEQLAAWMELEGILQDPTFVACKRVNAADAWAPSFDTGAFVDAQHVALIAVGQARARGVAPSSEEAAAIVERFTGAMTEATTQEDRAAMRTHMRVKYDPRGARYWELVAIMKGDPPPIGRFEDWWWLGEAMRQHLGAA